MPRKKRLAYQSPQSRNAQRTAEGRANIACCNVDASLS